VTASVVRPLTDGEFAILRTLIENETGLYLSELERGLVEWRLLLRVKALGLDTFSSYFERVSQHPSELVRLINAACLEDARFFGDPGQFSLLDASLVPRLLDEGARGVRPRRLRVWSAACSTGEEPYSIAMLLAARLTEGWSCEIIATDLNTRALARAVAGVYPIGSLAGVPEPFRARFLLLGAGEQEGTFRIVASVRKLVKFYQLNPIRDDTAELGSFDLLLFRNVPLQLRDETRHRVTEKLVERLAWRGYLFLDRAGPSLDASHGLTLVLPGVYQRGGDPL
jgi:chemotaxis protein methyltransferase CheR